MLRTELSQVLQKTMLVNRCKHPQTFDYGLAHRKSFNEAVLPIDVATAHRSQSSQAISAAG